MAIVAFVAGDGGPGELAGTRATSRSRFILRLRASTDLESGSGRATYSSVTATL